MQSSVLHELNNGIAVIHSNQLESLQDILEYWLRQYPLTPLENEILLVQSNGMGQWIKQSLAQNNSLGVSAAIKVQLPALFIWGIYRAVLGARIPRDQWLAKAPLTWRLYRLLPKLLQDPEFAALAEFLHTDNDQRKRYQLAEQLADLFDQYQVYRSDWIVDWADGHNILRNPDGKPSPLPEHQSWQAALWRAVLTDLGEANAVFADRASVHSQFMLQIERLQQRPAELPRRIILFGLSSLPQQSLEVLAKLGKFCQIILFVHNPCRHYWADIIEGKEWLKAQRRQAYKSGMNPNFTPEMLHLHANPLLAAWGKQGRDYIRLLDHFDQKQDYAGWQWPEQKIDVFKDYGEPGRRSLLQQIQQSILDLEPAPTLSKSDSDDSLAFHIAHSPQREVEILHDQLLARFNAAELAGEPLSPRDIIVMVPDINHYAPHIRAVFGQVRPEDPRYIPYSLSDQQQREENALLLALDVLLHLPESRFKTSEILGLLEVPAFRQRFGIPIAALPILQHWLEQSGIRWGLSGQQRADLLNIPSISDSNSWEFGLNRLFLGYATGPGAAFNGIEPFGDIGGLDAQWLGPLYQVLDSLRAAAKQLSHVCSALEWQQRLMQLLDDFFLAEEERDRKTLDTLIRCLAQMLQYFTQGGMGNEESVPLSIIREAWLTAVDEPNLQQRFLSGRVNFCTLMPMRSIPFRLICLLGMNDGDYPRSQYFHSFDLMSQRGLYRPGDRSRRQDDQYLFLEALLSARQQLYISWIGRGIRDNSELPPSVLVGQLRDFLQQAGDNSNYPELLNALTVEHPLQPFSPAYVQADRDPGLLSYASEWFQTSVEKQSVTIESAPAENDCRQLDLEALARFVIAPVKAFCLHSLKFSFAYQSFTSEDHEPFGFDGLQMYQHSQTLLLDLQNAESKDINVYFEQQMQKLAGQGKLPLGGFAQIAFNQVAHSAASAWRRFVMLTEQWPEELPPQSIKLHFTFANNVEVYLSTALNLLRQGDNGRMALIFPSSQNLVKDKNCQRHKLVTPWLQHLAVCAEGLHVTSFIAGSDQIIQIQPVLQITALTLLQDLVHAWVAGLQSPLPIACRTAFAWMNAVPEKALEAAQMQYEGDNHNPGEIHFDAYLARFYPDFASLISNGHHDFENWSNRLYRPMVQHLSIM